MGNVVLFYRKTTARSVPKPSWLDAKAEQNYLNSRDLVSHSHKVGGLAREIKKRTISGPQGRQ